MSWMKGLREEIEWTKRIVEESRIHLVLDVPPGFSIKAHIEQTPRGGERVHLLVDGPGLQNPER